MSEGSESGQLFDLAEAIERGAAAARPAIEAAVAGVFRQYRDRVPPELHQELTVAMIGLAIVAKLAVAAARTSQAEVEGMKDAGK